MAAATSKAVPASRITFYTNPLAFHPAKVALMLSERKLDHTARKLDLLAGKALEPWFIRLNPSGAVPAIEHEGKVLTESLAICRYLDALPGGPLGGDVVDRAFVEQFIQDIDGFDGNLWAFAHTPPGVTKALASVGAYRAQLAAAHGRRNPDLKATYDSKIASMTAASEAAKDPQKVAACEAVLVRLLDTAEARLSTGGAAAAPTAATAAGTTGDQQQQEERFLGGPAYSIADAMFTPILYRVTNLGSHKELIAPRPAVAAYMRRLRARPSWQAAFGEGDSGLGKLSWFLPALLKSKVCGVLRWY